MSTSSIKITELISIGANISSTTLLPVVDMTGAPETKKTTIQEAGNLILSGAGLTFAPANHALTAQTVSNAAQPNITSVGTLTTLDVTGNLVSGNVDGGNLVVANYFSGDGGLLSNLSVESSAIENGNSSVVVNENGNVNISVAGAENVLVISDDTMILQGELVSAYFKTIPVTFSVLPDASSIGAGTRAFITDSSASAFGEVVAGDGANIVPVYSDGTNWLVG